MVLYKGDPLVKGKLFKIESEGHELDRKLIKYLKKTNDGYIFESDGTKVCVKEEELNLLKEASLISVVRKNKRMTFVK